MNKPTFGFTNAVLIKRRKLYKPIPETRVCFQAQRVLKRFEEKRKHCKIILIFKKGDGLNVGKTESDGGERIHRRYPVICDGEKEEISIDYGGIPGDLHFGLTKTAGAREPMYKKVRRFLTDGRFRSSLSKNAWRLPKG